MQVNLILNIDEEKFQELLNEGSARMLEKEIAHGFTVNWPLDDEDEFNITLNQLMD